MKTNFVLVFLLAYSMFSYADDYVTGVSTEAISLPSFPGSVEGLPVTVSESGNKGQFGFTVEIKLPKGVNGLSPSLKLSYNSAEGQGDFGLGWSLNLQTISRNTSKGVPTYTELDTFSGPDGELVKIEKDTSSNVFYVPYINKNQNLYEFNSENNTWIIHQYDGRKLYFGTTNSSVIGNPDKVFKWFVEKVIDSVGNEIRFEYSLNHEYPYLSKVKYAYKDEVPHYVVQFTYEDRPDVLLSYKSTELVKRTQRCKEIFVKTNQNHIIRSYEFSYEDQVKSLLKEFRQHGEGGADLNIPMPPLKFEYLKEGFNENFKTTRLEFKDSHVFPPSLNKERTTLVDINRDSFPDILETSRNGAKVWLNQGNETFDEHYEMPEFISVLGVEQTKLLDVDGDRVVDFVGTGLYPKFFKGGVLISDSLMGYSSSPTNIENIPRYTIGASNVKTIDLNADGRLDILAREVDSFKSFISTSSGNWSKTSDFEVNTGSFDLSSPYTFFADMNGDGLVDLAFVQPDAVTYLPNKGNGQFAAPSHLLFHENSPLILKLFKIGKYNFVIDVNGDGYSDLVNVTESTVAISLNEGNGYFAESLYFLNVHEDEFNLKGFHVTVADINGNTTSDLVWTNDFQDWRYLDFSSGKLNLLSKVDNSLGLHTHLEYSFASRFGTHDESLETILPYPVPVLNSITETFGREGVEIRKDYYKYFGGYYDAFENDFRGFSLVEKVEEGDDTIESILTQSFYEQGRNSFKDHQQSMLLKRLDFEYDSGQRAVGNLLKGEEFILKTLNTFTGLDLKKPGMPFASETIFLEGDFEGGIRKHKVSRDLILSSDGFVEREKILTFIDLNQKLKLEEQVFAINNTEPIHLLNRVCEKNTYDAMDVMQASERLFFDNQPHCSATNGLLTKKEAWTGAYFEFKNSYTYHSFGVLASFSDAFNHTTTISYDDLNINPLTVSNSLGHTKTAIFNDNNGLMTGFTDENNLTTHFYYDLYLRINKIVGPADTWGLPTTEAVYEFGDSLGKASSLILKKREKSGVSGTFDTKEYFDGKSRRIYKISEGPVGKFILVGTAYNKRGEEFLQYQKSFIDGFNFPESMDSVKAFRTSYDSLKRPLLIFNPEHSTSLPSYKEFFYLIGETVSYDEERKVSYDYTDTVGRRVGHKDSYENEVHYSFDIFNKLTKIISPQGEQTLFEYDTQGRKICKLDPTIGLERYTYNAENLITQKDIFGFISGHNSCNPPINATPRKVSLEYNDDLNRLTKVGFPAGSETENIFNVYDEPASSFPKGRLTSVSFGVGSKKFDYDIYGNKSKTTLNVGISSYLTEKIFDVLGRVEKIVYPALGANSLSVKYEYDEATNLFKISDNSTSTYFVNEMTYSPLNQIQEMFFGNNTKTALFYDDHHQSLRLTDIIVEKIGIPATTLQKISFEYDKVSNITQRNDELNNSLETYIYDDVHRLTSATIGSVNRFWSFDEVGNITSNSGVLYNYDLNRKQIITSVGVSNYSFDPFGNLIEDQHRSYSYDWNNRLKSIIRNSIGTSYDYDESGIRVRKITPSLTTVFIDKYTELRGSDVIRHIYGNDKLIASIDQMNAITYNHADHLNSSNLRTDSSGNVIKRIEYFPFGGKRNEVGVYNNIKNRFTNQYEDEESDLYYFQQRFYDPVLSRFISADPLYAREIDVKGVNGQELNLYAYVRNNPVKYVDITGENPVAIAALGFILAKTVAMGVSYVGTQVAANASSVNNGNGVGLSDGNKAFSPVVAVNAPQVAVAGAVAVSSVIPAVLAEAGARPDLTSKVIENGLSVVDRFIFSGQGQPPGGSPSPADNAFATWDAGLKLLDPATNSGMDAGSSANSGAKDSGSTDQPQQIETPKLH